MSEPGKYILAKPVSKAETGRLGMTAFCTDSPIYRTDLFGNLQHRMWLSQHHGLYSAPISNSTKQRVVDIGCGTGIRTPRPRRRHYQLTVNVYTPRAYTFVLANVEGDWSFATEPFDLICGRMFSNSIRNWPRYLQCCLQHLKPGRWLGSSEVAHRFLAEDGCGEAESPMLRWWHVVFQASSRKNCTGIDDTYKHAQQMRDVGFVDVQERVFIWSGGSAKPSTKKDKTIGDLQYQALQVLIGGVSVARTFRCRDGNPHINLGRRLSPQSGYTPPPS